MLAAKAWTRRTAALVVVLAGLPGVPIPLLGQGRPAADDDIVVSVQGVLADPLGEFETYVNPSPGLDASLLVNFDRDRQLGLRLDGSWLLYGHETQRRPLSPTIPRIQVDVETKNEIYSLTLGPQFTPGSGGGFRPYLHAGAGFSYFATTSSVEGSSDELPFASSRNFDDFTFAWRAGAGLRIRVARQVAIDLGADYLNNGRVRYLREGGIEENPDGSITVRPIESDSNILLFRLGVGFLIGREASDGELPD